MPPVPLPIPMPRATHSLFIASAVALLLLSLAGCLSTPAPMPTVSNVEAAGTAQVLTKNAPPPGFEKSVQYPKIEGGLSDLPAWRATLNVSFDGLFSGTQDKATGQINTEIFSNELVSERRVLLKASGPAFGLSEDRNVEGVRARNEYYLVNANKACTKIEQPGSGQVADFAASSLAGGIKRASPAGVRKTENKVDIWEYVFSPEDVVPPAFQLGNKGRIEVAAGDLWVAPSAKAVWRYEITLNIDNVIIQGNRPLTGQLRIVYQLIETGTQYNISIPYGC